MRSAHTVAQVREAEAELMEQLPDGVLMQRAAGGLAFAALAVLDGGYGRSVLLLVGSGNNGGDALFAGAFLARRGAKVTALLLAPEHAHPAGREALIAAGGRVTDDPRDLPAVDAVLDGIVGIGGSGGLRPDAAAVVAALRGVPVIAVDVPSGVDSDTGCIAGPHVSAAVTVTFGTSKVAHLVAPAAHACGVVHLVDIGLDAHLPVAAVTALQAADVAALLPVPSFADHKYTRGVVGVRAGSAEYPGAGVLCVAGASCGLAGMVRYDGAAADLVRAAFPEVVVNAGQVQAWVVGSGGGAQVEAALSRSVAEGVPVVVDADALAHVTGPLGVPAVLTPHAGELARMLEVPREQVEDEQLRSVREAAERFACVVLLKGSRTLVATPAGDVRVTTVAPSWLATAGAGDVLAGICGALLAAGLTPFDAASVGSWLHGAAATQASNGGPLRAGDVARAVPELCRALLTPVSERAP